MLVIRVTYHRHYNPGKVRREGEEGGEKEEKRVRSEGSKEVGEVEREGGGEERREKEEKGERGKEKSGGEVRS